MNASPGDTGFDAPGGFGTSEDFDPPQRKTLSERLEAFLDAHIRCGTREWAVACHLLPLLAYAAPLPGLSALFAWGIWRMKRDSEEGVAANGREALNMHLCLGLASLLTIVLFPLWIAVNGFAILLAIRASLATARGESWRYPYVVRVVD